MPRLLTADDIIPLVASLNDEERLRLHRWIMSPQAADVAAYDLKVPGPDEFAAEDESLGWEAEGWDDFQ